MKKVLALVVLTAASFAISLPSAAPAFAAAEVCTSSHTGETFPNGLIVPDGARCTLRNSTVQGNVAVGHRSALGAFDSTITGNVYAEDATIQLGRTSVGNNVTSIRPTHYPVGETFLSKFVACGSTVGGTLLVSDAVDGGQLAIGGPTCATTGGGNTIGGSVLYRNNSASVNAISDNRAASLICSGNTPAPTGSGNIARFKTGQCASL